MLTMVMYLEIFCACKQQYVCVFLCALEWYYRNGNRHTTVALRQAVCVQWELIQPETIIFHCHFSLHVLSCYCILL